LDCKEDNVVRKKLSIAMTLIGIMLFMTGCMQVNESITPESTGIWNQYFVYPLSWLIIKVAEFFGENYGISIVLVTILIRLVLLPLMIKQTKSSKAMQELQPEMKKLKEKYSSKDQKTQKKLQEETMKLFQENGANPLAGCFPILIQMPILIAFYHAIMRTGAIAEHTFLWFSLGSPDYILPIIAGITTFIQQKLMLGKTGNINPQMAMMTYVMPLMIGTFAFFFPAALALYWVVGNIFMIVQTYFIYGSDTPKTSEQTGGKKK
jgi:YidC/Oxa1 family membrane protein insertase